MVKSNEGFPISWWGWDDHAPFIPCFEHGTVNFHAPLGPSGAERASPGPVILHGLWLFQKNFGDTLRPQGKMLACLACLACLILRPFWSTTVRSDWNHPKWQHIEVNRALTEMVMPVAQNLGMKWPHTFGHFRSLTIQVWGSIVFIWVAPWRAPPAPRWFETLWAGSGAGKSCRSAEHGPNLSLIGPNLAVLRLKLSRTRAGPNLG